MAKGQSGTKIRTLERINQLARSHSKQAISTIKNIMLDETAADAVRLKAAELMLDRAVGKATQKHEQTIDISIQSQHLEAIKDAAVLRLQAIDANKAKVEYVENIDSLTIEHQPDQRNDLA